MLFSVLLCFVLFSGAMGTPHQRQVTVQPLPPGVNAPDSTGAVSYVPPAQPPPPTTTTEAPTTTTTETPVTTPELTTTPEPTATPEPTTTQESPTTPEPTTTVAPTTTPEPTKPPKMQCFYPQPPGSEPVDGSNPDLFHPEPECIILPTEAPIAANGTDSINGTLVDNNTTAGMPDNNSVSGNMTGNGTDSGNMTGNGTDTGNMTGNGTDTGNMIDNGTDNGNMTGNGTDTGNMTGNGTDTGSVTTLRPLACGSEPDGCVQGNGSGGSNQTTVDGNGTTTGTGSGMSNETNVTGTAAVTINSGTTTGSGSSSGGGGQATTPSVGGGGEPLVNLNTTYTENENCTDDPKIDCRLYNATKICSNGSVYRPWTLQHCKAYCGLGNCQKPTLGPCVDEISNCDEYQDDMCTARLFTLFREKNCRKFCNICDSA